MAGQNCCIIFTPSTVLMKQPIFFIAVLFCFVTAKAQSDFTGKWQGRIAAFNLRIIINISEKEGKLVATMESPDQGAKDIPCDQVVVNGNSISISVSMAAA